MAEKSVGIRELKSQLTEALVARTDRLAWTFGFGWIRRSPSGGSTGVVRPDGSAHYRRHIRSELWGAGGGAVLYRFPEDLKQLVSKG
jgi:hypothetical protein